MNNINKSVNVKLRSPLLSALCILTFIGSTTGFIGYFLAAIFYEHATHLIIKYSSWTAVDSISPFYFALLMLFFALSLTGAIRMWKLHRDGFYVYLFSQLAILFLPVIWINWNALSATNSIFAAVFIIGYLLNYRQLE